VDDLTRPFLSFLNARYAIAEPAAPEPAGWKVIGQTREGRIFENAGALPRAFVPARVRIQPDAKRRLEEMAGATDFADTVWLGRSPHRGLVETPLTLTLFPRAERGETAKLRIREIGTDLLIEANLRERALVATSVPDWPGWRASSGGRAVELATVNHAFVGFWLPSGVHVVRLRYLPSSFLLGVALSAAAVVVSLFIFVFTRRREIA
jgi:hypothetical protein